MPHVGFSGTKADSSEDVSRLLATNTIEVDAVCLSRGIELVKRSGFELVYKLLTSYGGTLALVAALEGCNDIFMHFWPVVELFEHMLNLGRALV